MSKQSNEFLLTYESLLDKIYQVETIGTLLCYSTVEGNPDIGALVQGIAAEVKEIAEELSGLHREQIEVHTRLGGAA